MALGDTVETQVMNSVFAALEMIKSGNDQYNTDVARIYKMYGNVMEIIERPAQKCLGQVGIQSFNCFRDDIATRLCIIAGQHIEPTI